jgi:hypothetical protein
VLAPATLKVPPHKNLSDTVVVVSRNDLAGT